MQVAQKKDKIVENVLLDFSLEIWYYIYRGKKKIKPSEMELCQMKRTLNKKHLLDFVMWVILIGVFLWIMASIIDIDLHNNTINPQYANWNLFNLFF